jgi:hypothetical protein
MVPIPGCPLETETLYWPGYNTDLRCLRRSTYFAIPRVIEFPGSSRDFDRYFDGSG